MSYDIAEGKTKIQCAEPGCFWCTVSENVKPCPFHTGSGWKKEIDTEWNVSPRGVPWIRKGVHMIHPRVMEPGKFCGFIYSDGSSSSLIESVNDLANVSGKTNDGKWARETIKSVFALCRGSIELPVEIIHKVDSNTVIPEASGDEVVCQICGFKGKSLVTHLNAVHATKCAQYKEQYPGAKIVALSLSNKFSQTGGNKPGAFTIPKKKK